jgi:CO/xanthine dehydrogenase Mo-binding subunit
MITMKSVGQGIPKMDALAIATGKPVYTQDLVMPNTLVVKVLHSPYAFAEIKAIDTRKAKKLSGVECILTYEDVPKVRFTVAGQSYPEPSPYDRLILDKVVRYVGDAVAIIAAVDEKTALRAMKLIKVDYEIFEPVLDFETAMGHASIVHREQDLYTNFDIGMEQVKNIIATHKVAVGNIEAELKKCTVIVEETYYTQAQAQGMMETYRSFNYLDHMGRLVVISSTQIPFHVRRTLARALQIPESKIRVIKPRIGGGFGGKQTLAVEIFTALVTWKTGKPAQIVYDRTETFTCTSSRHAMRLKVRLGADQAGLIKVVDIEGLSDGGAYGEHSSTTFGAAGEKALILYNKTTAARFSGYAVYTNKMPGGALRGYGATQATFALESTLNKLAEKLHMDPTEIRLKNIINQGENYFTKPDVVLGSSTLDRCIMKGKELIGWDEKYPYKDLGNGKVRGLGMAVTVQGSGIAYIDTAAAELHLNSEGSYTLMIGSTDMGTGSDTILAQFAAEVLETTVDNFIVYAADTDVSPYDPGSYASSTTYVTGMAVVRAAQDLKAKIIAKGAKLLEVLPEQIEFDGTVIKILDSDKTLTLKKLAETILVGPGHEQLIGTGSYGSPVSPPPFIAGFAEVEVDKGTGKVDVIHYVAVVDCGTVVNPKLAKIQVEGGIVQGIGMALYEDVRYGQKGNMQTNSFMQYKIPCRKDIGGCIEVAFEPSYEPTGPFGAKSIGEVVINTPPAAIAHAVYNAVGVTVTKLPITPEKIFMAMKH